MASITEMRVSQDLVFSARMLTKVSGTSDYDMAIKLRLPVLKRRCNGVSPAPYKAYSSALASQSLIAS